MATISDFKSRMIGGGARANQFRATLTFPTYVSGAVAGVAGRDSEFLCRGAALPGSTIGNTPVNYRGRVVNFGGERTFTPWTVTIYNDTSFAIRDALEIWQNGINNVVTNRGRQFPAEYLVDLRVDHLDRNDDVLKSYIIRDAYPTNIGEIALDFGSNDAIAEFTCEFTYQFFESTGGRFGGNVTADTTA
jgi:hypothetical protein|tara:strand:+ start:8874 stop:9443 length:570 start_codon:yes stop_codon:yes gene_type:complete